MGLKDFFTPVASMSPDEARAYIQKHSEGAYTILDVRQPKEYEQSHLPGARLVPLPQLSERLSELEKNRPAIVYCASGGRSRVAAQMLSGNGFTEVYNLSGGIKAWSGHTAAGPPESHLNFVSQIESPEQVLALAWHFENAQSIFYRELQDNTTDKSIAGLFEELADYEENHKMHIAALCREANYSQAEIDKTASEIIEGGFGKNSFLTGNRQHLDSDIGILSIAMMLEAQSLDLYMRLASETKNEAAQQILLKVAQEEKHHLLSLATMLEAQY